MRYLCTKIVTQSTQRRILTMWYRMRMERLPWMRKAYMHNCPLFLEHDPSECGEVRSSDKAASWSDSLGIPLIIAPKPAVSSSATQSFEKKRNSIALFAREINLVTQPSFDCEQGINSQVQTVCSNADAVFPVLGIVFCKNERFSLSRKTHVPLWNEPRISHVRLL